MNQLLLMIYIVMSQFVVVASHCSPALTTETTTSKQCSDINSRLSCCAKCPKCCYFIYLNWRLITILQWFCHTLTWISHGCTCAPHPEPPSHLPPHPTLQGHPSAPALSALPHASNLDWRSVSHMIIYKFQCYFFRPYYPCLLPQSPKDCSIHLCLFCCLT